MCEWGRRFLATARRVRRCDRHAGRGAAERQNFSHVFESDGDAARRRPGAGTGQMKEYGTARALNARTLILGEDDDDVIQSIVTGDGFVASSIGQPDRAIVVAVARGIAPAIRRPDRVPRQGRSRNHNAITPVKNPPECEAANGCCTVAFPLAIGHSGTAKKTGHTEGSGRQKAADGSRADRANVKACEHFPHGELSCAAAFKTALLTVTSLNRAASPCFRELSHDHDQEDPDRRRRRHAA